MCKIRVSVSVSNQQQKDRAAEKLKALPNVVSVNRKRGEMVAIVDHPDTLSSLQAASWVKDQFGMSSSLIPSAMVMT